MRFGSPHRLVVAALLALLPLAVWGAPVRAQTIVNTAEATWSQDGTASSIRSNTVEIPVEPQSATIRTFRVNPIGGSTFTFLAPRCGITTASAKGGGKATHEARLEPANAIPAGEYLYFTVDAPLGNLDRGAIDRLDATFASETGDRETITIFETSVDSGVFAGRIVTSPTSLGQKRGDCRLGAQSGGTIQIAITAPGGSSIITTAQVTVLADPFGVVFDSETGEPVDGARVTLVDGATGQPATVFGPDGVTPWPSSVVSGDPITDRAGNVTVMPPGEYWFPLTGLGRYRLVIEPPSPYTAPSQATPDQIARITRPDGRDFVILDASYGGEFVLNDPTPVEVDIPLDRPSLAVGITKTVSRPRAEPGDLVIYNVTVANRDPSRIKRDVVVVDTPSHWLRLRRDTVRIDGAEAPSAVSFAADGSSLTIALGDLPGGATRNVTYAMAIRPDAAPGRAINRAEATDARGRSAFASAFVEIERDTIAGRMTVIGRVAAADCSVDGPRVGIPGVRVMMEDGSFAITDADGRYHFDGVVPGTHVVQASRMTLPEGARFVDCQRDTRSAGKANSRFVKGQGGSLLVADFDAVVPTQWLAAQAAAAPSEDPERTIEPIDPEAARGDVARSDAAAAVPVAPATNERMDWIALGDGPDGWLAPSVDHNPRAPSVKVAIRHRATDTVTLMADGTPVDALTFEGTRNSADGTYAVSQWRGVPLVNERTELRARIAGPDRAEPIDIARIVYFTSVPARAELVRESSNLVADGRTNPVVAVRLLDRNDRPLREGLTGEFQLSAPYQSAEQLQRQQLNQLTGIGSTSARWEVVGNQGIALIELAPTMVSGSLRLDFRFTDGQVVREQQLETWIVPGDLEWTVVGLAEGTIGARTVADNMERAGRFDSDLGDDARVAFYAKGRVLGKFLVTLAYDSAKQRDDQRVLGAIDPNAYYTVYADATSRQFDAASREKLYVRIESAGFYAIYGDFETGFDQTALTRYGRTATGFKGEARFGGFSAQGFAAEVSTQFRRDEIQGQGVSGPYRLSHRRIVVNTEQVVVETRDRFRSEVIVDRRELTRFVDYDLDLLSGTITLKQPLASRDFLLNPQFLVVDYEIDEFGGGEINAGARVEYQSDDGVIRIGASAITDKGNAERTNIGGLDLRARVGVGTEVRAEVAVSERNGATASGWLVEAQHQSGALDALAYVRSLDRNFGVGQQNGAELGRRKFGADLRYRLDDQFAIYGSAWQDDSLTDDTRRRAAQVGVAYTSQQADYALGLAHFDDRLPGGRRNRSTVLEGGATQRLFDNKLELAVSTSIALDDTESVDLPTRHRLAAGYTVLDGIRLIGLYEIAEGERLSSRTVRGGVEIDPWAGGQIRTALGQQRIDENGRRSFAAYGLTQSLPVTGELTLDFTVDGNVTLDGAPPVSDIVNIDQPVASGGQFGPGGNTLFEDFTALTAGASWRKDRWSATLRGEYRDGEFADLLGVTGGAIRQLGEGSVAGSGVTWTRADAVGGASTEIVDAAIALAHRPSNSEFALLAKVEYRSDAVTDAVAGEAGPAGRTALAIDGDAHSRRLIASTSMNWFPRGEEEDENGVLRETRRDEYALFLAVRHNLDQVEGFSLEGTTVTAGAEARFGIGSQFEIGARGTVRHSIEYGLTDYSFGPQIGFSPTDDVLVTVGYNFAGFRDEDFGSQRNTDEGVYAAVRFKFDADTFGFLGLER